MKNTLTNKFKKSIALKKQRGSAVALILGSIVVLGTIGYIGSTIYGSIVGGMQRTNLVVQTAQSVTQAGYTISTETVKNASGIPVAASPLTAVFSPTGGGQIPTSSAAPKTDSFGSPLGYCTNNALSQSDPVFAIISAGSDKTFQTTCAQALIGSFSGDDKIVFRTVANIVQGVGGTVYFGDPVAQITSLGSLSPVKSGEFRVVTADGSAWTNKTGTPGQANWTQVGSSGSTFVDDIGLIVQSSYSRFNINNTKYLPADGSSYQTSTYPILSNRAIPSAVGAAYTITQRTLPANLSWSSVVFGNGLLVTVANGSSNAATSPDGINWTLRNLPISSTWNTIIFGNGLFLATSANSTVSATSTDGISWTQRSLARAQNNVSSAYGNGVFFVLANGSSKTQYSVDGINFNSPNPNLLSNSSTDVAYGNGKFVIVENSTSDIVKMTPDGLNFTTSTLLGLRLPWSTVTFGNGKFLALAFGTNIGATSTDGVTWTQVTLPSISNWSNISFGNGIFTAIATGTNTVIFSSDGINWVQQTLPLVSNWKNIAYNGSVFSVISNTTGNIAATISVAANNFSVPSISGGYFFVKALP